MRTLLCLALMASACTQSGAQSDDPANLKHERVSAPALADTLPINHGMPGLEQLLKKLQTRASMMLIVAHPDDEDGGLLTLESRGNGARVATLTLTRGEGGQNLMSADFNDALGLIRTQELLAADRFMGVDQMFGTEVDFGFSKTLEETLKQWGHDRVLYDAVHAVRLYRPLVLASVFVGGVTDGHGQHQVSGLICQEVFNAAADPKIFPEMGLPPWAPLKVYARVPFSPVSEQGMYDYATGKYSPTRFTNYVTGKVTNAAPVPTVLIHEGAKPSTAAFEGMSYVQFARQGLALQKSQIGPGIRVPPAGVFDVGYKRMASRLPGSPDTESDLFEGIDTSIAGIASLDLNAPPLLKQNLAAIDKSLKQAQSLFEPANPALIAPSLHDALKLLDQSIAYAGTNPNLYSLAHELKIKRVQANDALVLALRLSLTAGSPQPSIEVDRPTAKVSTSLANGSKENLHVVSMTIVGGTQNAATAPHSDLTAGSSIKADHVITLAANLQPTRPYFSRKDISQPFYDVSRKDLINAPETPNPFVAHATLDYHGVPIELAAQVAYTPPHPNEISPRQPLVAVPPLTVSISPALGLITPSAKRLEVTANLSTTSATEDLGGEVSLKGPSKWTFAPIAAPWKLSANHPETATTFSLNSPASSTTQALFEAQAADHGRLYTESFRRVGYNGLTFTNFYTRATFHAVSVDVHTAPGLRVAYLPGTGDEVAASLPLLGVTPTIVSVADLTPQKLANFDAIILGVRAYSAHHELSGAGSKSLLDFASAGGVVIAQYNSGGFDPASAPYPLTLPGDPAHNVVDESQPVKLLEPTHPLLQWPNKISPADFNDWIEERGHGFASDWAKNYQALLETHDIDQDPQSGGLLVAPVAKGAYVYCALALYRQLPEGVPGAYRVLANLISYAKNPTRASH